MFHQLILPCYFQYNPPSSVQPTQARNPKPSVNPQIKNPLLLKGIKQNLSFLIEY